MSRLTFVYGPVSTGKTVELLVHAHQITKIHGKGMVKLLKPSFDIRDEISTIKSASGMSAQVDYIIAPTDDIREIDIEPSTFLLVDEVQFLTEEQMVQLRKLSLEKNITVDCYGLLKDFRNDLFPTCSRLIEIADEIRQVKTFCYMCSKRRCSQGGKTASFNLKILKEGDNLIPTLEGESKQCGGIEMYVPVCSKCYYLAFKDIEMTSFLLSQQ